MSNINTSQTVYLYTTLSGGIQPYDQCARWAGGWTASNGNTGTLAVGPAGSNIPYLDSNNTPCAIPGTDGGSLTGTLMPNGFTGDIGVWVEAADSEGVYAESNHKYYTVIPLTGVLAYAGPDQAISGVGPNTVSFNGATASGGTPPYTYEWSASLANPYLYNTFSPNIYALNPTNTGFYVDGTYQFSLKVTDSMGATGTDSLNVNVTGATPPTIPFTVLWDNQIGTTISGRSSTLKIWHQPYGSVTWNLVETDTATTTAGHTGTVTLQLVDPTGDQIKVNVTGTNTYKNYAIYGDGDLLDSKYNITTPGTTGTQYVDSTSYSLYSVYSWTDFSTCLGIGSLIKMADGSEIKVEDLKVGDLVASLDIQNSDTWNTYTNSEFIPELTTSTVSDVQSYIHGAYVRINDDFNVSESHPLFVYSDDTYKFVTARELSLTDKLITETGELINVTSVNIVNEPLEVYLVSTDPSHIYIANGVINHNKRATILPAPPITP